MDKKSISQQDANLRVDDVWNTYPEEVAKNESLAENVLVFRADVAEISKLEGEIEAIPKVTASAKSNARAQLEAVCLRQSKQVHVFAESSGNFTLLSFLLTVPSAYVAMRSAEVGAYARALMGEITANADQLVPVGIGEVQIAELTAAMAAYKALIEDPRALSNKRKKLIADMKAKITSTKHMLDKTFDFLIDSYPSDSDFVKDYKLARIVVDPATHHHTDDDDDDVDE